jgi:hypothetical protein
MRKLGYKCLVKLLDLWYIWGSLGNETEQFVEEIIMKTSVPIFCCSTSRDKAYEVLREKFPSATILRDTGWFGNAGIEIKAGEKDLQEIIDFIESDLSMILVRFACVN